MTGFDKIRDAVYRGYGLHAFELALESKSPEFLAYVEDHLGGLQLSIRASKKDLTTYAVKLCRVEVGIVEQHRFKPASASSDPYYYNSSYSFLTKEPQEGIKLWPQVHPGHNPFGTGKGYTLIGQYVLDTFLSWLGPQVKTQTAVREQWTAQARYKAIKLPPGYFSQLYGASLGPPTQRFGKLIIPFIT